MSNEEITVDRQKMIDDILAGKHKSQGFDITVCATRYGPFVGRKPWFNDNDIDGPLTHTIRFDTATEEEQVKMAQELADQLIDDAKFYESW